MINVKKVFNKILREWGHDILLQRRLSDDFVYDDILERYTTRSLLPRNMALANAQEEVPEGIITNSELVYYFEHNVNPKAGDRIYEQSYNTLEESTIYKIDDAYPVRGRFGEINYWIVGATRELPR
jgi:hypothetical protein